MKKLGAVVLAVAILAGTAACGGQDDAAGGMAVSGARGANVIVEVRGEGGYGDEAHCMLHWSVTNRQQRDLNLMIGVAASRTDGSRELSSPTFTVALRAPAGGTGEYPGYSLSGAACVDLLLAIDSFMCFGGDSCVAQYRSSGVAGLAPPAEG